MPSEDWFNVKFQALKNEHETLQRDLSKRIAKVAKYVKTGDAKLLAELEELDDTDPTRGD